MSDSMCAIDNNGGGAGQQSVMYRVLNFITFFIQIKSMFIEIIKNNKFEWNVRQNFCMYFVASNR